MVDISRRELVFLAGGGLFGVALGDVAEVGLPAPGKPVNLTIGNDDDTAHEVSLTVFRAEADEYSESVVFSETYQLDAHTEGDDEPVKFVKSAFPGGTYRIEVKVDSKHTEHFRYVPDCGRFESEPFADSPDSVPGDSMFVFIHEDGELEFSQSTLCSSNSWML